MGKEKMSDTDIMNEEIPQNMDTNVVDFDPDMEDEQSQQLADAKKEEGNNLYKDHKYTEALACYTEAITICPTCAAFYGNRSATYIMLNKYKEGLADAQLAIQLDTGFVKGYLREGKCHLALGSPVAALRSYRHAMEIEPNNTIAQRESTTASQVQEHIAKAEACFEKRDYRTAIFYLDRCIEHCVAALHFKIQKAEALALMGKYQESQEQANDILQREGMNADALYVRGMCLYYQDNTEKAFQHFQEVLRRAPDHHKAKDIYRRAKLLIAKKEEGNTTFKNGKFQEAYDLYSEALSIDPNNKSANSKLFCNRATVCSKLDRLEEAIQDCTKAIELDETYLKAYMRRAKCYNDTELYEEAVRDYEQIYKMAKTKENKQLLQNAKLELKKHTRNVPLFTIQIAIPMIQLTNRKKKRKNSKNSVKHTVFCQILRKRPVMTVVRTWTMRGDLDLLIRLIPTKSSKLSLVVVTWEGSASEDTLEVLTFMVVMDNTRASQDFLFNLVEKCLLLFLRLLCMYCLIEYDFNINACRIKKWIRVQRYFHSTRLTNFTKIFNGIKKTK